MRVKLHNIKILSFSKRYRITQTLRSFHHWRRILIISLLATAFVILSGSSSSKDESSLPTIRQKSIDELYNLLVDDSVLGDQDKCTIDYINAHRLQQDHPCVIRIIRRHYLRQPSPPNVPYELLYPEISDHSRNQSSMVLQHLHNKTSGFFIESGALDGEFLSNTLYMERFRKWTGILIEPDQDSFDTLMTIRRKSYALPVCLSLQPYPTEVKFNPFFALGSIVETNENGRQENKKKIGDRVYTVQCFPLYSIMLAVNRTTIDYFSLDIEGHELRVLQTIPWHKVQIEVISVEWEHIPEGKEALTDFLGQKGYYVFDQTANEVKDYLFARNASLELNKS